MQRHELAPEWSSNGLENTVPTSYLSLFLYLHFPLTGAVSSFCVAKAPKDLTLDLISQKCRTGCPHRTPDTLRGFLFCFPFRPLLS